VLYCTYCKGKGHDKDHFPKKKKKSLVVMIDEGAQDALIEYTGEDTNYENLHNCINNVTLMHCTILPETHDNLYITRAHLTLEFHVDCIIDNRSQKNLILISLVDKLKLPLEPHTYPYSLGWKDSSSSSKITHTFTVSFSLGPHFVDEVTYDVIRMDYYGSMNLHLWVLITYQK